MPDTVAILCLMQIMQFVINIIRHLGSIVRLLIVAGKMERGEYMSNASSLEPVHWMYVCASVLFAPFISRFNRLTHAQTE